MTEGDVFRWAYRDRAVDGLPYAYYCKSRFAVVRGDHLVDTYWGLTTVLGGPRFPIATARETLELDFLGNLGDFERRGEAVAEYYDPADVLDLNHANSTTGNLYVRRGAVRSRDRVAALLGKRLAAAERQERAAAARVASLRSALAGVANGTLRLEDVPL